MELTGTIPALLTRQTPAHGSHTILRKKDRGIWKSVTWAELDKHVRDIGQGLRAAGVKTGDTIAMIAATRPEFAYADLAILGCGAAGLAINPDAEAPRVEALLRDSGAVAVMVEGEEQLDKVLSIRAACPSLWRIVIADMKGLREFSDPMCVSLADLVSGGTGQSDWGAVTSAVQPGATAVVLGSADGSIRSLTHEQVLRHVANATKLLGVKEGDERLAVLPMSDPGERIMGLYLSLANGIVGNYLESPETATENLREVKPTIFGANTEAWDRLHARIEGFASAATLLQRGAYRWAIAAAAAGGLMGSIANALVLPAVRAQLGFGRLRVAFVGDGAVSLEIARWAGALGVTVRHVDLSGIGDIRR